MSTSTQSPLLNLNNSDKNTSARKQISGSGCRSIHDLRLAAGEFGQKGKPPAQRKPHKAACQRQPWLIMRIEEGEKKSLNSAKTRPTSSSIAIDIRSGRRHFILVVPRNRLKAHAYTFRGKIEVRKKAPASPPRSDKSGSVACNAKSLGSWENERSGLNELKYVRKIRQA